MKKLKKVSIIIPAYNEARTLPKVLAGIKKTLEFRYDYRITVVNDGSNDQTGFLAKKPGTTVITNKTNIGTGRSTAVGLAHIIKQGASIVVLMDADGQHDPKHIPELIWTLDDDTDLVIASRYLKLTQTSTSLVRRMGTKIISLLIYFKYKKRIFDPTSGFRVMNRRVLKYLSRFYPTTFSEPEVVIELLKNDFKIKEISVEMKPRAHGKSSVVLGRAFYLMKYIVKKIIFDK